MNENSDVLNWEFNMNVASIHIAGLPATFATRGEKPWKECLASQIPPPYLGGAETGVALHFTVLTLAPRGHPLDVDNLCEPVFSVLINRIGWFGGARLNLAWWEATKALGKTAGCHLKIVAGNRPQLPDMPAMWDEVYEGPLPEHAKSVELAQWAWRHRHQTNTSVIPERCTVYLGFGSLRMNLGGISAGGIKAFVDCLYPLIGGQAGAPEDHRISKLEHFTFFRQDTHSDGTSRRSRLG